MDPIDVQILSLDTPDSQRGQQASGQATLYGFTADWNAWRSTSDEAWEVRIPTQMPRDLDRSQEAELLTDENPLQVKKAIQRALSRRS